MTYRLISILLLSAGLSACNWVDSKGNQSNAGNQLRTLVDGGQLLLLEGTPSTATFTGASSSLTGWQWQSTDAQSNGNCSANNGFDSDLAADSLKRACTDSNDCEIQIQEQSANGATQFSITAPSLKAPVAIAYKVATSDEQGNTVSLDQTLCLVSINESPSAEDSTFTILKNQTREVNADDPDNLLANVVDDVDVRNQPLRVIQTPLKAPKHAEVFQLGTDGGFVYRASAGSSQTNEELEDEFVYQITDGIHTTSAKVTLRIVANNSAPIRTQRTGTVSLSVDEHGTGGFEINLAANFLDPDGDILSFSTTEGSLPASGNITLTNAGLLFGKPQAVDVGDYIVTIIAGDGIGQAADTFILSIARFSTQNSAPEVDDIPNSTVKKEFSYNVAPFFEDEDDDELQFSAAGLPSGVTITASGLISGTATSANKGAWIINVTADDGRGGVASDSFRLRIR